MKRNDGIDFEPDANGAGRDGFREGDPDAVPVVTASEVNAVWLNAIQEEVCRAIEIFGGTLDGGDVEQLGTLLYGVIRGSTALPSPFSATVRIPAVGASDGGWSWTLYATGEAYASTDSSWLAVDLGPHLPNGATLTSVKVRLQPGAARVGPNQVEVRCYPFTGDGVAGTAIIPSTVDDGTALYQTIQATGLSVTVNKATTRYLVHILSGNSGGGTPGDRVAYIEVTYTDNYPGRR